MDRCNTCCAGVHSSSCCPAALTAMLLQLAPQRSLRAAAALHLRPRHRQLCRTRVSQQPDAAHAHNHATCGSSSIAAASRQRSAPQHAACTRARSVQCFSTSTSSSGGSSTAGTQDQQHQQHQRQLRIAVVGAGVAGLTSALRVLQVRAGMRAELASTEGRWYSERTKGCRPCMKASESDGHAAPRLKRKA